MESTHWHSHTSWPTSVSSITIRAVCEVTPVPETLHHVLLPHGQGDVGVICWRDGGCAGEEGRVFTQYPTQLVNVEQHYPSHIKCKYLKKASDRERIIALDLSIQQLTEPGYRVVLRGLSVGLFFMYTTCCCPRCEAEGPYGTRTSNPTLKMEPTPDKRKVYTK